MSVLYVMTRVLTGRMAVRAYLCERGTNKVVWMCPHLHHSRIAHGGKNGTHYATKCGERELRRREEEREAARAEYEESLARQENEGPEEGSGL